MDGYPVREIFRTGYLKYAVSHPISPEQKKAARAISACKTGELGYNKNSCENCGYISVHANSCRNRHCPNCQAIKKELWVDARSSEVIDGPYYHVVFTVPAQLNPLIFANQKLLYSLLHECSANSVLELAADKKYLGAKPAIIQLLHTWGQKMNFHPHIHSIISGSGLSPCNQLISAGSHFFLPVKVLAAKFKGKFMAILKSLHSEHKLQIPASNGEWEREDDWNAFCFVLYGLDWNVNIKETFNGNGNAIEYLGRYAYRIAISNNRILSYSADSVSFSAKNYKTLDKDVVTLSTDEFIHRFLMHVLPAGFQKIRYYGILAGRNKNQMLKLIFRLQGHQRFLRKFAKPDPAAVIKEIWQIDITRCPCCGKPFMPLLE